MDKNEIRESRNEVSRIVKKPVENIYGMSSLLRVFFARAIDVFVIAIPSLIVMWCWNPGPIAHVQSDGSTTFSGNPDWVYTIVTLVISLCCILFFLVVLPSFTHGTTIGKFICGIRLKRSKGDKKVKWYMLLARETYFMIIPWLLALIMKVIALAIIISEHHDAATKANTTAQVINQCGYILYFVWFLFLLVTIKAQSEHQAGIDMHFGLYVVYKEPIKQITKDVVVKETSVILTDEPGNLSKDNLDELRNDEARKFDKSISLEDLDLEIDRDSLNKKKKETETKKLESKDDKKNKGDKK